MQHDITCKKAVDLISKKEEGKLTTLQRFQLWRHLTVCSLCRRFSQQNGMFKKVREFTNHQHLDEDDKQRIINSVLGERDSNL